MLATLPKLADRNFIIGFFVPALLAAVAAIGLFNDTAWMRPVYEAIWTQKKWEEIGGGFLLVWVVAILLLLLNHLLYRVAEGYTPPFSWLGNDGTERKRSALIQKRLKLIEAEESPSATAAQKSAAGREIDILDVKIATSFPQEPIPTLPTQFGSVIRAFEAYAATVYGVDSIAAWPRLTAVMSKEYASATADARAEVDFFLNSFFLSIVCSLLACGRLGYEFVSKSWLWNSGNFFWISIWIFSPLLVAWACYRGAVWRAAIWGTLVKGAFDVYLPALANSLGYQLPPTSKERQEFWNAISLMFLYLKPMEAGSFPHAVTPAAQKASAKGSVKADDGDKAKSNDGDEGHHSQSG